MEQTIRKDLGASSSGPAKVLIVDDHPAVREGLTSRISRQRDLIVCGEAATVAEALRLVEITEPDVVVIDISLSEGNGIDLIKRIRTRDSSIRMLACSMHPDSLYAERALRAGALGYINKDNTTGRILDAIRSVRDGDIYLSEDAMRRLVHKTIGHSGNPGLSLESLSDRELEIFKLIGEGHSTSNMASQLHLSVHTVDTYRRRIRLKLNIRNAAELVHTATEWVLVEQKNRN
jgi:DNA-binding NarL/FixJ family response regulator